MLRRRREGLQLYLCALSELQESWDSPVVKHVLRSVEDSRAGHAGEQVREWKILHPSPACHCDVQLDREVIYEGIHGVLPGAF